MIRISDSRGCPSKLQFVIGTFTDVPSQPSIAGDGIQFVNFDGTTLKLSSTLSKSEIGENPTYITTSRSGLFICNSISPNGTITLIRKEYHGFHNCISSITMPGQRPTHVSIVRRAQREFLLVANVRGGTVKTIEDTIFGLSERSTFIIANELASKIRNPELTNRQRLPNPHMVLPYKEGTIVPDLGSDYLFYLSVDEHGNLTEKQRVEFTAGDGPRHAISHSHGTIFVVNELSVTVTTLRDINDTLTIIDRRNVLNIGLLENATAAAIRLSNDQRYLYISVRPDSREVKKQGIIVAFEIGVDGMIIRKIGEWSSRGVHPRDFYIVDNVRVNGECRSYVVVANRDSDNLTFIRRWELSGILGQVEFSLPIKAPSSVLQLGIDI